MHFAWLEPDQVQTSAAPLIIESTPLSLHCNMHVTGAS